jgi:hypothetical protein
MAPGATDTMHSVGRRRRRESFRVHSRSVRRRHATS